MSQYLPSPSGQAKCTAAVPRPATSSTFHLPGLTCSSSGRLSPKLSRFLSNRGPQKPMAFLSQHPAELDHDEIERLDFHGTRLFHRARCLAVAWRFISLFNNGFLLPRGALRRCLSRPRPPPRAPRCRQWARGPTLPATPARSVAGYPSGMDGELGEDAGDGRVVAQEVSSRALAMTHSDVRCRSSAGEGRLRRSALSPSVSLMLITTPESAHTA
jgi:hypothetical protein